MDKRDLLILGAGPAGCAAATVAARAGVQVALLERSVFPRHRPGETLHPGIEPLLERFGARDAFLAAGYVRHPGTWIAWGEPARFEPFGADDRGPWLGFQVDRADFDSRLLAVAVAAGVEVRNGTGADDPIVENGKVVGVRCDRKEVRARFVIDAMGDRHRLARQLGIPIRRHSRPLQARYGYVTGSCSARDESPLIAADEHGWTWTARVGPDRYQWTRLDLRQGYPASDWRPTEFTGMTDEGPVRGADVTWRIAERVAGAGFFLVGDAAAVLDPVSSHGVLRATMSGILAGHLAAHVLLGDVSENAVIAHYQTWLTEWFHRDLSVLQRLYGMLPEVREQATPSFDL